MLAMWSTAASPLRTMHPAMMASHVPRIHVLWLPVVPTLQTTASVTMASPAQRILVQRAVVHSFQQRLHAMMESSAPRTPVRMTMAVFTSQATASAMTASTVLLIRAMP